MYYNCVAATSYGMDPFQILNISFLGNTVTEYVIAVFVVFGSMAVFRAVKFSVLKRLKPMAERSANDFDDLVVAHLDKINWIFWGAAGLYITTWFLELPQAIDKTFLYLFFIVVTFRVVNVAQDVITFALKKAVSGEDEDAIDSVARPLATVSKIVLWFVALILLLSNFGVNVNSLIAGLGIGGIAIALAAQSIFKDAFSAISIYLDKPFEIGDFIIFDGNMGTVDRIGIKTTRIMTLQGEELVVSNSALIDSKIQNFKKMKKRRIGFTIGVTYDTSVEKLRKIPKLVTGIMDKVDGADLDRCHFKEFADFSLNFETVYYVLSSDYNQYMDIQQQVNLGIKEELEKEGIEFAFPTQTLYLKKEA